VGYSEQAEGVSWQEIVATIVVLMGLGAAAFLVGQRPAFWVEFGVRISKALWPLIVKYVTRRMDPETENAWRDCMKRGGEWDYRKKRCKR
jgi:hypothetical protein